MITNLTKGEEANLTKKDPTLKKVRVGLGWDIRKKSEFEGGGREEIPYDLDASAFLLNNRRFIRHERDFIFYNNMESIEQSVLHLGDNDTGAGEGDDETIRVNLDQVPFDVHYISFAVTIHDGYERQQQFNMVQNAYIRVMNDITGEELAHFDLTDDYQGFTGVVVGELYRIGPEWIFVAKGEGAKGGLPEIAKSYDVNVIAN